MKLTPEEKAQREIEKFKANLAVPRPGLLPGQTLPAVEPVQCGLELSAIAWLDPAELRAHPLNEQYFRTETPDYFQRLKEDIGTRGILVPLIARLDGTLLAGHNRLKVALEIGLAPVPVQRLLTELSSGEEEAFLIKDNLLRRQLSAAEKKELITRLYGSEILKDRRGGDRKSERAKIKSSTEPLIREEEPIARRIERETGIKAGTAKRLVSEIRREQKTGRARGAAPQKNSLQREKLELKLKTLTDVEASLEKKLADVRHQKKAVLGQIRGLR